MDFLFYILGVLDFLIFVMFLDGFVFCLFVVVCFWYTFAVSILEGSRTESDFRCTETAECTDC